MLKRRVVHILKSYSVLLLKTRHVGGAAAAAAAVLPRPGAGHAREVLPHCHRVPKQGENRVREADKGRSVALAPLRTHGSQAKRGGESGRQRRRRERRADGAPARPPARPSPLPRTSHAPHSASPSASSATVAAAANRVSAPNTTAKPAFSAELSFRHVPRSSFGGSSRGGEAVANARAPPPRPRLSGCSVSRRTARATARPGRGSLRARALPLVTVVRRPTSVLSHRSSSRRRGSVASRRRPVSGPPCRVRERVRASRPAAPQATRPSSAPAAAPPSPACTRPSSSV